MNILGAILGTICGQLIGGALALLILNLLGFVPW